MISPLHFLVLAACLLGPVEALLVRKNVESLSEDEILSLMKTLREVSDDTSASGYAAIASYHGYPPLCKDGDRKVACCHHGGPEFPYWHRLYVVQMEQALKAKGLKIGVPYWDWTQPLTSLPDLVSQPIFMDSDGGKARRNVWYQGEIQLDDRKVFTARAVDDRLFQKISPGQNTDLFEQILSAMEYSNYCQFAVQLEIAHNTIHYLVGGTNKYSMSHLEYTSYDPIFFLHHSNLERMLEIYLHIRQSLDYSNDPWLGEKELCGYQIMGALTEPYSWDSNPINVTRLAKITEDSIFGTSLGYRYDDLTLNGYDVEDIKTITRERMSHDRAFASFRLSGIGGSANVKVEVCTATDNIGASEFCVDSGDFFLLGGPLEMAWTYTHPYFFEITKTVQSLGLALDGSYWVKARVYSVNGTQLPSDIVPAPSVHFRPAVGRTDPPIPFDRDHVHDEGISIRKNVDRLTREEELELREAMRKFQSDESVDGYQATAEFHGDPGKCPHPNARDRLACCVHGAPTFPHWHRLFVVQVENALRRRGSPIGMPYWDWTRPGTTLPRLAAEEMYLDPHTGANVSNPFYSAEIGFLGDGAQTTRDVQEGLSQSPDLGDHTDLFDACLLALEQDNFCDFEVQLEVAHNMIHALVGGNAWHGMSTLSYSAFDPIFYIHHSTVDRLWAIWTALQQLRGKPYKAHCAQSYVQQPLKPFSFSSPFNNDVVTLAHATPTNIYDYEDQLRYAYDTLEFGGMGPRELEDYINVNLRGKERMLVGVMLHGIQKSALGKVFVHDADKKLEVGTFALLGGPSEMAWRFDREYEVDITPKLEALGMSTTLHYPVSMELRDLDGTPVDISSFPRLMLNLARRQDTKAKGQKLKIRKNVEQLSAEDYLSLRRAMASLQADNSTGGFQTLGRFHGSPKWCPAIGAEKLFACCPHGMPVFPHWHRLLTVQAENALKRHGYKGGLPYWDWTRPLTSLPDLASGPTYIDPSDDEERVNPWFSGHIDDVDKDTVRAPREELFQQPAFGEYTDKAKQVLLALEQEDFCAFEVQYEIAHNFLHALIGGREIFSMASLEYTAFDPIFFLHHSNTDRIWAIWQALQKYRGKPYNSANCAIGQLRQPMAPFGFTSDTNPDPATREKSRPFQVFDYLASLDYDYDNLEFNGLTIPQLVRVLEEIKGKDRVFAGFLLHGIRLSALVRLYICKTELNCRIESDEFYILGSEYEMPWSYDRLYKYDITKQLSDYGLKYNDRFLIKYEVYDLEGNDLGQPFPEPTVLFELGTEHLYGQEYREAVTTASHVRKDLATLSEGETESLRASFLAIQEDQTYEDIAAFHGKPGMCRHEGVRFACCAHGSATFPAWHRLYVQQVEEALLSHGSSIAVPYWDWTRPITTLPTLINQATYFNSRSQTFDPNPFFSGKVKDEDVMTTRDPQPQLFNNEYFYEATLFALEQTNFCDFEIQLEVVHNALHSWLGGRATYSMSSLDYTAFDPVFFLHHANTDRLWAIWQELQRYRGLLYNEADCAINLMGSPLRPFESEDLNSNLQDRTLVYNRPGDTFDYRNHFGYEYDSLEFNHMTIPQLENLLNKRQETGRVFAGFLLHNIGMSADVEIYICVPSGPKGSNNCDHKAGSFVVLGGELEMPFIFDRLYKHDITKSVKSLGLALDNAATFEVKIAVRAVNGSYVGSNILRKPTIFFQPGSRDRQQSNGPVSSYLVRKNINSLTLQETESLVQAMTALQADSSSDGYQAIAAFHALPPLCPSPTASKRHACCLHGMATFPPWHRLYTVQIEDALRRHGALVGLPYWDWTRQSRHLADLLNDATFTFANTGVEIDNPWFGAEIAFENASTARKLDDRLFEEGPHGWDTWFFNQTLLALEQDNFCDFEVQLEVTHNAVHSWMGGSHFHSMSHLHYASYDPAFYIHHSNTDRLWALWQALQDYRGHNPADLLNCALEKMREPLKPFSFGPPYNMNPTTKEFSKAEDTVDYQNHFGYRYDDLEFVGMTVPELDAYIREVQARDRVFAGFMLKGFYRSAIIEFDIVGSDGTKHNGGYFTVLGGSAEMPWQFDRLYKYDITHQLSAAGLRYDDNFDFQLHVTDMDEFDLDGVVVRAPSVFFEPARRTNNEVTVTPNKVRRNLNTLSERDSQSLMAALGDLQRDTTVDGWANLTSFHGAPGRCVGEDGEVQACCVHGMPSFPHWHRLFTLQVEQALRRHGSAVAIPYWDWTMAIDQLPSLFTTETYYDIWRDEVMTNPFVRGYVPSEETYTVRNVRDEIHLTGPDGVHSGLFELVILALEQTDYCDFEVQFEVMHNAIHFLVGGHQTYSLSSLEYSAYDPLFFVHHSFIDKIWAVWQELQKRRGLPHNTAGCALNHMTHPLRPFHLENVNFNTFTRTHAVPNTLFDYRNLGYAYDDLTIGGKDLASLEREIATRQSRPRVFAGFLLKGIQTSGSVFISICKTKRRCISAGHFNLLGGPTEMPWAFDRLYKYDITDGLRRAWLQPEDVFNPEVKFKLQVKVYDVKGQAMPLKSVMPEPTIMFQPAAATDPVQDVPKTTVPSLRIRKDVSSLTEREIDNLREALRRVQNDTGPNGYQNIASMHGLPARCEMEGQKVACCQHGMATFPQWHRLLVKHFEDALAAQGAKTGIPYWEWTAAFTSLPRLVVEEREENSFLHGTTFDGHQTSRSPRDQLFNDPELGFESFFYTQLLLAFEQTDYCDFEVQYEVTHNAIHSWTGGRSSYGMSSLEYTAYDPLFLLHHSNVDRQFAIWQALQKFRGLPHNSANCAIQTLRRTMAPFGDESNPNPLTRAHSKAVDAFDYDRLYYQYDDLNFHGLTIAELDNALEKRKEEDRVFALFLLHGIAAGADVNFRLCDGKGRCVFAGTFAILGGPYEMSWAFDRLYKYDVTDAFQNLDLRIDDAFHFEMDIIRVDGVKLDPNLIKKPSVEFIPGVKAVRSRANRPRKSQFRSDKLLRKDINQLTRDEVANLRDALFQLQADDGPNGFEAIAGFHGAPFLCPQDGNDTYACCAHGAPTFPQWHRLHTVQFEQALKAHGAKIGIPYWDWMAEIRTLPSLFGDSSESNPFYKHHISFANADTQRDVQNELFNQNQINEHNELFSLALNALEEDDYCDFVLQLEILHNKLHAYLGGSANHSMSTLDYSAFDPVFMILHSSFDRFWLVWQELQKTRHKPYKPGHCGRHSMEQPLVPFSYPEVNTLNDLTRRLSDPWLLFHIDKLGYEFDTLGLNGHSIDDLHTIIAGQRTEDRLYLGILFASAGASLNGKLEAISQDGAATPLGTFHQLGGPLEMPWSQDRIYKHDITDYAKKAGIDASNQGGVTFKITATRRDGLPYEDGMWSPLLIERPAQASYDIVNLDVSYAVIPAKLTLKKGTKIRFTGQPDFGADSVYDLGTYTNFVRCDLPPFSYRAHSLGTVATLPVGDHYFVINDKELCSKGHRIWIAVEDS